MFVVGLTVLIAIFQLKSWLGVDVGTIVTLIRNSFVVGLALALTLVVSHIKGWPLLWEPVLPMLWCAWWPLVLAKGMTTPKFFVDRGIDPQFEWWAADWVFWAALLAAALLAAGLYWRRWQRPW